MDDSSNDKILKLLKEKVQIKNDVLRRTKSAFDELKNKLATLSAALQDDVFKIAPEINFGYRANGDYEVEFSLADEFLVFVMHTNVFSFDNLHGIWKTKYIDDDPSKAFCGKIFIYNFLTDSFKYQRNNDVGFLIARIFINKDGHYFVEGKKQLGYLYNDFSTSVFDSEAIQKVIDTALIYCLDFDPFTPPFEKVAEVSVRDVLESGIRSGYPVSKRLGFQFPSSETNITSVGTPKE